MRLPIYQVDAFTDGRIDPCEHGSIPELRKDTLCFGQILKRESALLLNLLKQAENHLHPADNEAIRDQIAFRCLASSMAAAGSGCHLETPS
jgi:hypothetical protein